MTHRAEPSLIAPSTVVAVCSWVRAQGKCVKIWEASLHVFSVPTPCFSVVSNATAVGRFLAGCFLF